MKSNQASEASESKEVSKKPQDLEKTKAQEPLLADDPLWETLGSASQQMADPFFARNIVRETRQLEDNKPSFARRAARAFSWKTVAIPTAIAACLGAALFIQVSNKPVKINTANVVNTSDSEQEMNEASDELLDIVIDESLAAAAEDPSLFTRDEIITLISL